MELSKRRAWRILMGLFTGVALMLGAFAMRSEPACAEGADCCTRSTDCDNAECKNIECDVVQKTCVAMVD